MSAGLGAARIDVEGVSVPLTTSSTADASAPARASTSAARSTGTTGSSPTSPPAGPSRGRPGGGRGPPGLPRLGGAWARGPPRAAHAAGRLRSTPRVPDLAKVECVDNGSLHEAMQLRVLPRAANNIRFFADYARERLERSRAHPARRGAQPGPSRPLRRGRRLDAVERAVHARHLARGPGAGGGQHGRAQAAGVGAAHLLAARATWPRRRASPRECSTSSTAPGPAPARRSPAIRTSTASPSPGRRRPRGPSTAMPPRS